MSSSPFLSGIIPAPAPAEDRYIWAKVTQSSPLRIQVDGDRDPLPITPDDLGGGPRLVNQRVYCQILNRRLVVLGPGVDLTPPGVLVAYANGTAPPGWLRCDGTAVSRTTYARLFAVIGTEYGAGDGSTTFNIPSLTGRVVVGYTPGIPEFGSMGKTGGSKTHTLTEAEMPSHTHVPSIAVQVSGAWSTRQQGQDDGTSAGAPKFIDTSTVPIKSSGTTLPTSATGGGGAHNNLQPYIALNYMIKT